MKKIVSKIIAPNLGEKERGWLFWGPKHSSGKPCVLQAGVSGSLTEPAQVPRDTDLSPGQPLQSNQPSGSPGVIGRRSISDLGAIGGSSANSGGMRDQVHNLQMLEAAFYKLPQPKDSEHAKSYIPVRKPLVLLLVAPEEWGKVIL